MKNKSLVESKKEIEESIKDTISVGDIFLDKYSNYEKVVKIMKNGVVFVGREKDGWEEYKFNPEYPESGCTKWHYIQENRYVKIQLKGGESLKEFHNKKLKEAISFDIDKEMKDTSEQSTERALAILNKDFLVNQKKSIENITKKHEILARILEKQKNQLEHYVSEMTEKIEKMNKVIGQIELYLGINEEIVQIKKGTPARVDTPIHLRQQILYMDEETGALLERGGLDYKNISQFDDWVTKDNNHHKLIPEEKGVVIVRVRRTSKDYQTGNAMLEGFLNQGNFYTYILIRNGENLYRIWANIIIKTRLFPTQEDMDIMINDKKPDLFDSRRKEDMVFSYRQNLLMLQGLIDRTQILRPFSVKINLFKPDSYGDCVKFIRDDEPSLTAGQKTFKDWKKELNSKIARGTRVYFCGFNFNDTRTYDKHSRYSYHRFPHYVSNNPNKGIYSIKRIEEGSKYNSERLVCHYNPKDEIWKRYGEDDCERKNSIPFYLYCDDWCVLNYDLITIEDIDYFMNSRFDRGNYLEMLPILYGMKKQRLEEIEWEKGFVDRLALEFKCEKKLVWSCISWWKNKVIWKRPIMSDDAKALRMIRGRIKKTNGEKK